MYRVWFKETELTMKGRDRMKQYSIIHNTVFGLVIVGAVVIAFWPVNAFAQCTTWIVNNGGQMKTCVQCCHNGVCNVNCY